MMKFEMTPSGVFNLANTNQYFGGWTSFDSESSAIGMAFPVEGWRNSAAVILRQDDEGVIHGEVHHAGSDAEQAWRQALAVLSLDADGAGWSEVGQHDPVIGNLQNKYQFLRPVLFHSPYEAAAAFIIGHRISMQQGRAIRQAMAQAFGDVVSIGDTRIYAFPRPQVLLDITEFNGISAEKVRRLKGVAQAALDGWLDRKYLLSLPTDEALEKLRSLDGIGEFFAQGILFRGAGAVDVVTDDDVTKQAVQRAYQLPELPDHNSVLQIAEKWRPFRMWATVNLHVWLRREAGGPQRPPRGKRTERGRVPQA